MLSIERTETHLRVSAVTTSIQVRFCYSIEYLQQNKQPDSVVVKHSAISVGGLGFNSQAGQSKHSVINGSSLPLHFYLALLCVAQAPSSRDGPHHSL